MKCSSSTGIRRGRKRKVKEKVKEVEKVKEMENKEKEKEKDSWPAGRWTTGLSRQTGGSP